MYRGNEPLHSYRYFCLPFPHGRILHLRSIHDLPHDDRDDHSSHPKAAVFRSDMPRQPHRYFPLPRRILQCRKTQARFSLRRRCRRRSERLPRNPQVRMPVPRVPVRLRKRPRKRGSFRQILFVTSRKNNLQNGRRKSVDGKEDELHGLREAYANRGRKDKYEDEVLFLNALPEILKDNLKTLTSDRVIQPYLCKLPEYDKLTSKVVKMATSTVLQDDEELYKEVSKEAVKLYFEFRKRILPAYRRETNESRKMTLADLGEMDGYGWLFNLYPDLLEFNIQ